MSTSAPAPAVVGKFDKFYGANYPGDLGPTSGYGMCVGDNFGVYHAVNELRGAVQTSFVPTAIELHDSESSRGVAVDLG